MRLIKAGNQNWAVTEAVNRCSASRDCKPVEGPSFVRMFNVLSTRHIALGMLSCQQTQNVIDGKKRIILNPNDARKRDFEACSYAENEVYGMDVCVSLAEDSKARIKEPGMTIFQRDSSHCAACSPRCRRKPEPSHSISVVSRARKGLGWGCKRLFNIAKSSRTRFCK
jgi:hypothetical protein